MEQANFSLLAVFSAGLLSFFSPCVLPLIPTFSSILSKHDGNDHAFGNALYWNTAAFLCGFTVVFLLMGASATTLGKFFFAYREVLEKIGAILLILMGINLLGIFKFQTFEREYRPFMHRRFNGFLGSFLLGSAFTLGWTPCIGPILATVLFYAGGRETVYQGAFLLLVYAAGFSIPFFLLAVVFKNCFGKIRVLYPYLPHLQRISGAFLIAIGIAIWMDMLTMLIGRFSSFTL